MQQFNVHEAKSNLSRLLDLALEGEKVVISRHGKPVARLAPVRTRSRKRILGTGRGSVTILSEDWAPQWLIRKLRHSGLAVGKTKPFARHVARVWAIDAPARLSRIARRICSDRDPAVSPDPIN